MSKPTIGRIVHYVLTADDANEINRRRTSGASIAERLRDGGWPRGAQAHIGNPAREGEHVAAIIVQVWPNEYGPGFDGVNLQCFLDGNDALWKTSIGEDQQYGRENGQCPVRHGTYHWPERD